jgi:hypothetical protein
VSALLLLCRVYISRFAVVPMHVMGNGRWQGSPVKKGTCECTVVASVGRLLDAQLLALLCFVFNMYRQEQLQVPSQQDTALVLLPLTCRSSDVARCTFCIPAGPGSSCS